MQVTEQKLLLLRLCFFVGMLICFSATSFESFKKWIDKKSSIAESDVDKEPEPLPTFSICTQPAFDKDYLTTNLSLSPNFFFYSNFLSELESDQHKFPSNLSEDLNAFNSLHNFWTQSVLSPVAFVIGMGENGDMIVRDENFNEDGNLTELVEFEIIHSLWYGKCTSFVPKIPKKAKEELFIVIVFHG